MVIFDPLKFIFQIIKFMIMRGEKRYRGMWRFMQVFGYAL